jgi:hypothetical protein
MQSEKRAPLSFNVAFLDEHLRRCRSAWSNFLWHVVQLANAVQFVHKCSEVDRERSKLAVCRIVHHRVDARLRVFEPPCATVLKKRQSTAALDDPAHDKPCTWQNLHMAQPQHQKE